MNAIGDAFRFSQRRVSLNLALFLAGVLVSAQAGFAQRTGDPIWTQLTSASPDAPDQIRFRKAFTLVNPAEAQIRVEATGPYELYLNTKLVQRGTAGEVVEVRDLRSFVQPGLNLLAIRVSGTGRDDRLSAYFRVRENGEVRWRSISSDASWVTSDLEHPLWNSASLPDRGWVPAVVVQPASKQALPSTAVGTSSPSSLLNASSTRPAAPLSTPALPDAKSVPAGPGGRPAAAAPGDGMLTPRSQLPATPTATGPAQPATAQPSTTQPDSKPAAKDDDRALSPMAPRLPQSGNATPAVPPPGPGPAEEGEVSKPEFRVPEGFVVEALAANDECGSVIAMAIDEAGRVVLSRESGGLIAMDLTQPPGNGRTLEICSSIRACQGILPLNGNLYVTGQGPEGVGLYELVPQGSSRRYEVSRALLHFSGEPGEHGPHGVTLGNDGLLYVVVGNGSQMKATPGAHSPFRDPLDIDIVPRVEDPGGHAVGVRAPGGTVVRVGLDGSNPEIVAGGIRNAYDLVFNPLGDLFIHDSDMESDAGMSWQRSTQLYHVPLGGDLGWRSGWSNLPAHCLDVTPPLADTGRGSPTGAVCYQHLLFPARYHNALFLADWSEGRILVTRPEVLGGSYTAATETFLSGRPMNVTDLAVAEDGSLLFCTGGRGTWGGVFRVRWDGKTPSELLQFESDLARALRSPQPDSAWARQNLALLSVSMGERWGTSLTGAASEKKNTPEMRIRALDLMYLYGVVPADSLLDQLLQDSDTAIRARAARLCGVLNRRTDRLVAMLGDSSPNVRRAVCEALLCTPARPDAKLLFDVVADEDRAVSLTAMRLLQRQPVAEWLPQLLASPRIRTVLAGSMAAMASEPGLDNSYQILAECSTRMRNFVSDRDFTDLLRVVQVALVTGGVDPAKIPAFAKQIQSEFPTTHPVLNAELAKVLVALRSGNAGQTWIDWLKNSTDPETLRIQTAMYLAGMAEQLNDEERLAVIEFLHSVQSQAPGGNRRLYLAQAIQKATRHLGDAAIDRVLAQGATWNQALIPVFYRIEGKVDAHRVSQLIFVDRHLQKNVSDPLNQQARLGIIALLADAGIDEGWNYLRTLWRDEPARRLDIAIGLAQKPDGENWSYLVASLPLLDDLTAREILGGLLTVPQKPVDARHYRDVIEMGYRLGQSGGILAARLVEYWADEPVCDESAGWKNALHECSVWYQGKWPGEQPVHVPEEPVSTGQNPTGATVRTLLAHVEKHGERGNPERGLAIYKSANCAACHRFGTLGDSSGPDLTSLASRFSRRETLESIVHPDANVPAHFRASTLLLKDGTTQFGLVSDNGDETLTLTTVQGEKIRIAKTGIESQKPSEKSPMPAGLLDSLDPDQVNDLIAFLYGARTAGNPATAEGATSTR